MSGTVRAGSGLLPPMIQQYEGWKFECRGVAHESCLLLYGLKAHNVPDTDLRNGSGVADPFLRVRVENEGLQDVKAETREQKNQTDPVFADELQLLVPSGLEPKLVIELWDKDYEQHSLRYASNPTHAYIIRHPPV